MQVTWVFHKMNKCFSFFISFCRPRFFFFGFSVFGFRFSVFGFSAAFRLSAGKGKRWRDAVASIWVGLRDTPTLQVSVFVFVFSIRYRTHIELNTNFELQRNFRYWVVACFNTSSTSYETARSVHREIQEGLLKILKLFIFLSFYLLQINTQL